MAEEALVIFKGTTIYTKCHKRILMHSNTVNKRKSHTHDMYTFLTNRSLWWFLLVTFIGSATVRVIVGTLHCSSRIRVYILYSISMQVKYTGRRPHWLCFFRLCCMYYRRQWEEGRYELELASGITQGGNIGLILFSPTECCFKLLYECSFRSFIDHNVKSFCWTIRK